MFPHTYSGDYSHILEYEGLAAGNEQIDYLIGMNCASWMPDRACRAMGGGDMWLWRNQFGACVGGSHPWLTGSTRKSQNLFTVLNVLEAKESDDSVISIPGCGMFSQKEHEEEEKEASVPVFLCSRAQIQKLRTR